MHERELALTAIFDAAERHAKVEGVRADRLAALGYTGNLPDLEYVLPIHDYHLSAGFGLSGPLWESIHTGLDFGASTGTDLVAVADGTVTEVADAGAYGMRTILTLQDGTEVWYCHQLTPLVFEGQSDRDRRAARPGRVHRQQHRATPALRGEAGRGCADRSRGLVASGRPQPVAHPQG